VIEIPLPQSVDCEALAANLTTDFTERVELHLLADVDAEYTNPVPIRRSDETYCSGWFSFIPHAPIVDETWAGMICPKICTIRGLPTLPERDLHDAIYEDARDR
jgi:hypothetical protein